jgi:cellulose synthase operon protein C
VPYTEAEIWQLLREANAMRYGAAQIALAEEAIARADAIDAPELSFAARMLATQAYTYGGEPLKSLDTFDWCVTEYDRRSGIHEIRRDSLLWHFKWVVNAARRSPAVPLSRMRELLDEMERRYAEAGFSRHAVFAYRHGLAVHVGDMAAAEVWYQLWNDEPRDAMSDCAGCDPTGRVHWLSARGRDEEAIALAEPVLAGELSCTEQPQAILTALLLPYVRTGRLDAARDAHRRAYRLIRSRLSELGAVGAHLRFLAQTGNEKAAVAIVERHLAWLDTPPSEADAMEFAAGAAAALARAGDGVLHRPAYESRPAADVTYEDLAAVLAGQARELATEFDARNGSDAQAREVEVTLNAPRLVEALPLAVAAARRAPAAASELASEAGLDRDLADWTPDDLLDMFDRHWHCDRIDAAIEVIAAFDDRYAEAALSDLQRARRADINGLVSANADDSDVAQISWTSAIDLYHRIGDEHRRQLARCRLAVLMCRTERAEIGLPLAEDATGYLAVHAPKPMLTAVHRRMALAYMFSGRPDEALASLHEAGRYLEHDPYEMAGAKLAAERAGMLAEFGRLEEARSVADEARRMSRDRGYRAGIATSCWIIGRVAEVGDELDNALAAYEEGLDVVDDRDLRRSLRRQRAILLARTDRADQSFDDLIDEIETAVADGEPDTALVARHALAVAYLNAQRPLDAAEVAEGAIDTLIDPYDPRAEIVRHVLAQAFRQLKQPDEAIEQLDLIAASGVHRGSDALVAEMNEQVADILDSLDRDAEAAARYGDAAASYHRCEQALEATRSRRRQAMALMWAGRVDDAVNALAEADMSALVLDLSDRAVAWERTMLACEGARVLAQHGDLDAALIRAAKAPAVFRDLGDSGAARFAASIYSQLLDGAGRSHEAAALRRDYGTEE